MSDEKTKPNGTPGPVSIRKNIPTEGNVSIAVSADKSRNAVVIAFQKPITWLALDPLAVANMIKHLGEKLKELQN